MALNDARLAQLAREYEELRLRGARLDKRKKERSKKIIAELEKRGTKAIEHTLGRLQIRVNKVQNEGLEYDEEALIARLRRMNKFSSGELELPVKEVLDREALAGLVQAGHISTGLLAKHSHIKKSAPYINVTINDG